MGQKLSEKSKPRETGKTWHYYVAPEVLPAVHKISKQLRAARAMLSNH